MNTQCYSNNVIFIISIDIKHLFEFMVKILERQIISFCEQVNKRT